jgi:hypothetical protein
MKGFVASYELTVWLLGPTRDLLGERSGCDTPLKPTFGWLPENGEKTAEFVKVTKRDKVWRARLDKKFLRYISKGFSGVGAFMLLRIAQ